MPRQARYGQESTLFHVMTHAVANEYIFRDDWFKGMILEIYGDQKYEWDIYAYCIMDNHTHFIIAADLDSLSANMKSINIRFSTAYNRIRVRRGHVFQNRFKSVPIVNDAQLFENIRYIHNNPVTVKVVDTVDQYPYSSYQEFVTEPRIICDESVEFVREAFASHADFLKFHDKPQSILPLDTEEDLLLLKNNFFEQLHGLEKNEMILRMWRFGFNKSEIAAKIQMSRNKIARIIAENTGHFQDKTDDSR